MRRGCRGVKEGVIFEQFRRVRTPIYTPARAEEMEVSRDGFLVLLCLLFSYSCAPEKGFPEQARLALVPEERGVEVYGSAVVRAAPDLVVLRVGYVGSAPSAGESQSRGEAAMRRVVAALRAKGIEIEDVRTIEYSLTRLRDQQGRPTGGWIFRNVAEVRVDQVGIVASLIDAVVSAGANVVTDVQFTVSDARLEELRAKAREGALQIALHKAEQVAKLLDLRLGKSIRVSESVPYVQEVYAVRKMSPLVEDDVSGVTGGASYPARTGVGYFSN